MIQQAFTPIAADKITFKGEIGQRFDLFCFQRAISQEAWNVICRETVDAMRNKIDDSTGLVGYWQGEFWGKWILSAIDVYDHTRNDALLGFIRQNLHEVIGLQDENGYIGTYKNPDFVFHGPMEEIRAKLNWDCDYNWNIWSRKYTLWGLVEGARLLDDQTIRNAAVRLADNTLDTLERLGIEIWNTGCFSGLPSCSIMKPLLLLYEDTGTERYLEFAKKIAAFWDSDDRAVKPNLIRNALDMIPVHKWYPKLDRASIWTKSYEMMSCYEGILELYRITGEEKLLKATQCFWELVMKYEWNAICGMGYNDNLTNGAAFPNAITEPCDSIHFMRLCQELFRFTGDIKYINAFELNLLNAFMAAIFEDGRWGARGVRSSHKHLIAHEQAGMKHNHCCVNNMPRGIVTAARTAVMTSGNTIYLNAYTPLEATVQLDGQDVTIDVHGSYLEDGQVVIDVLAGAGVSGKLLLRMPQWSVGREVELDGTTFVLRDSHYVEVPLTSGMTTHLISFDNSPVIRPTGAIPAIDPDDAWHAARWKNSELTLDEAITTPHSSVTVGPLVLARSIKLGTPIEQIFSEEAIPATSCTLEPFKAPRTLVAFNAILHTPDGDVEFPFCDFASAGNLDTTFHNLFSIYF